MTVFMICFWIFVTCFLNEYHANGYIYTYKLCVCVCTFYMYKCLLIYICAYDIIECSSCCFKNSITQDEVPSKNFERGWHGPGTSSFGYN